MKKHILITAVLGAIMVGCALPSANSTTSKDKSAIEDTFIIEAPFNDVWSALTATVSEQELPIKTVDKESGVLVTKRREVDSIAAFLWAGEYVNWADFAYRFSPGKDSLVGWSEGWYTINLVATPQGDGATKVKIASHFEAYEFKLVGYWVEWHTTGRIEKEIIKSAQIMLGLQ